jgi:hypothetical protein
LPAYVAWCGTKRLTDPHLARALRDGVADDAIDANRRQPSASAANAVNSTPHIRRCHSDSTIVRSTVFTHGTAIVRSVPVIDRSPDRVEDRVGIAIRPGDVVARRNPDWARTAARLAR